MKITGNKLYQRVAASITDAIEAGRWSPGSRLPGERDLAEEYKVSRPTIREAMIALEMKGWIEARHGSGLYVTRRDHGSGERADALNFDVGAFDLTEARILFEGEAVALAAVSITDEQIEELEAILHDMGADDSDEPAVMDADHRFHLAIANATGNAAIRSVVEYLWDLRTKSPLAANMFARAKRAASRRGWRSIVRSSIRSRHAIRMPPAMRCASICAAWSTICSKPPSSRRWSAPAARSTRAGTASPSGSRSVRPEAGPLPLGLG